MPRTVTIPDRAAERARWGRRPGGPILRTVTLSPTCPQCGGPRGEPIMRCQFEDGETYAIHTWANPCGHVDHYADLLSEGDR